jgi:hypothetical protein
MNTPHAMDHHPHQDPQAGPYVTTGPTPADPTAGGSDPNAQQPGMPESHSGHGGHGLMMLVCCIPMILIAVALVATGVAGSGAIVGALLCTAMMAVMMLTMPGSHGHK